MYKKERDIKHFSEKMEQKIVYGSAGKIRTVKRCWWSWVISEIKLGEEEMGKLDNYVMM